MSENIQYVKNRFLQGLSTVAASDPMGAYPYPDPTSWAVFFDDFIRWDASQGTTHYTFTQTNGADSITGATGVLNITLAGADNDLGQMYLTQAPFQLSSGKKAFFECKCKVQKGAGGTIGEEEVFIGVSSVQTAGNFMAADGLSRTMDDACGFISYDGTTNVDCLQGEADAFSTEAAATTYADDTYAVLSWYYNGTTTTFYKDGVQIASLQTNPPTSVVTPMMFIKAGEATAKVLLVDYIMMAVER